MKINLCELAKMKSKKKYLETVPHPPTTPLLGNLLSVGLETPVQDLMQFARDFGPIYWLDLGKPVVIVSSQALVNELSDTTRFDKSVRGALRRIRALAGDGLFTAYTDEPNWSKAHNLLLPNFGQKAMQGYHDMMVDVAEQLVLKWERLNAEDEIDVVHDMTCLALETIGLCGFGYRFNSFYREKNHPFIVALTGALEATMKTRGLPLEGLIHKERNKQLAADIKFMNSMVDQIIKERKESGDDISTKPDLLSYMLSGVDKKSGERLDDLNIRYQIITFLIAGHETTSGMLTFATYFLLNHPDVLARCYEEVDRVLGPNIDARPSFAQVNQLTYISQVLKESLRLWPTAPAFAVYPIEKTHLGGEHFMKKNQYIIALLPMLHRDKAIWGEDAELFNPDHFSRAAEKARPANSFKPFGNGQRACIGQAFAMHEATLLLGMILQRFKLVEHKRYTLKIKETLSIKPEGLKIKVKLRADRQRGVIAQPAGFTPAAVTVPTGVQHDTPLLALYGSNMGTSEELARQIAGDAEAAGFLAEVAPLDDYVGRLPKEGVVVIATASYNGAPPDNAVKFWDWLNSGTLAPDAFSGVRYSVFGCGNQDWASTFQAVPRRIDALLAQHGGQAVHARGEGDARDDFDGQFQDWYGRLWPDLASAFGLDLGEGGTKEPIYQVETLPPSGDGPLAGPLAGRPVQILVNRELLNAPERSTRHIEIALPDGVTYRAGDHFGVVPHNNLALVQRVARRFGFEAEAVVRLHRNSSRQSFLPVGERIPVLDLLTLWVELQGVATRKQIQLMAEHTPCPHSKPRLLALCGSDEAGVAAYKAEVLVKRKSLIDLLEEFPACALPFSLYLENLAPLSPRYYSISSSPLVSAGVCSLTVAVVDAPARSGAGRFKGVCSNFLAGIPAGGRVRGFVKDTKSDFRLPTDPLTPIIMIGPGTGLAPFRGFLQERAAQRAQGLMIGPSLLFFGSRHPQEDFLYEAELRGFADQGVTQLYTAFSRLDPGAKYYVQHRLLATQDVIWPLLEQGAKIYVCGDATQMAPDVRQAFATIYQNKTGASADQAEAWLSDLNAAQRYLVDVWAAN